MTVGSVAGAADAGTGAGATPLEHAQVRLLLPGAAAFVATIALGGRLGGGLAARGPPDPPSGDRDCNRLHRGSWAHDIEPRAPGSAGL